jgi:hypothetical protein
MRESRTYGSVRGALSNERPYRDPKAKPIEPADDGFRCRSTRPTRCPAAAHGLQTMSVQCLGRFAHRLNTAPTRQQRRPGANGEMPGYSITSSAATSRFVGTVKPSALAVFKLIASSKRVDCNTGKSPGFSPFTMRPV